ncbi:MAG: DUF4124 domain-containing protein [Ottowia sp.]|uniref:DUF4124 domain-containing protein n=1 Tax=Ottowia sp. TaxID=1898956 RepID=UPI0039E24C52
MKMPRALLLGLALAASSAAFAQYSWIDKDGRKVFSDRPPPAEVPQKNVLSQPRGGASVVRAAPAVAPEAPASPPVAAASAPAGVDKALEEKKKQAEAAEAAQKKADEQRLAAARADNCKRAMNAKATLDSGMRVARLNDKGEREVLDDTARAAEQQRVQKIIASDCK